MSFAQKVHHAALDARHNAAGSIQLMSDGGLLRCSFVTLVLATQLSGSILQVGNDVVGRTRRSEPGGSDEAQGQSGMAARMPACPPASLAKQDKRQSDSCTPLNGSTGDIPGISGALTRPCSHTELTR